MDILDNQFAGSSEHALTDKMRQWLLQSAKWARFLSLVGFVTIGVLVLMIFSFGSIMSTLLAQPGMPLAMAGFESFLFIPFAMVIVFYFFPTLYLYQFASNVLKGASTYDMEKLETAFEKLKSFFKFFGVTTIVFLSFYGIVFLFALLGLAAG